jgi:3-hydroxyacyl-[acyl-carrier-protein] dehydratase
MPDPLEEALRLLPHGPEFRFVDRLLSLRPGQQGVAEYRVRGDEPFLRGHFPGEPLFPGVLLLEAAAQLAGVVAQSDPNLPLQSGLKLAAVRHVKILGTVGPGETMELEARIVARMGPLVHLSVAATAAGHLLMQGEVTLGAGASPLP